MPACSVLWIDAFVAKGLQDTMIVFGVKKSLTERQEGEQKNNISVAFSLSSTAKPAEFVINTCGAGSALLIVQIDGPMKVKLDVQEVAEGYKCTYYPTLPGEYLISIKYGGQNHIGGSPFLAHIKGNDSSLRTLMECVVYV